MPPFCYTLVEIEVTVKQGEIMSETFAAKGKCLCEKVSIEAKATNKNLGACHCGICRRWSGGPFLALDCGTDVTIEGEENLGLYESSSWAERGFCKLCGSNLFYRLKEKQQYIVSSEIFDELPLEFDHQIFIDEKPQYYSFSNKTKTMTGAEVMAAFTK